MTATMFPRRMARVRAILLLVLGLGFMATDCRAAVKGRVYGDFGIGAGYDDSVLLDASKNKSVLVPVYGGMGWRGRFTPKTTGQGYTRLSYLGYPGKTSESNMEWSVYGGLKHRVYGPHSALAEVESGLYRQPNFSSFNENRMLLAPGVESQLLSTTRVRLQAVVERSDYPKYDLDSRTLGFQALLQQDVTLNGEWRVEYRQGSREYKERYLFLNATGTSSPDLREDDEKRLVSSLRWDWDHWDLTGGYAWEKLKSNGNSLDYGPHQSAVTNTIAGDERLVSDFYSYVRRGPLVFVNIRALEPYLLSLYSRWEQLDYNGRIAKSGLDQFLAGNPLREDKLHTIGMDLTRSIQKGRLRLGWTARVVRERHTSNDDLYDYTHYRGMLLFRGWF